MKSYTIAAIVIVVLFIAGFYYMVSPTGQVAANAGPLKLGFIGPLSGDAAAFGETIKNSAEMAVNEVNEKGGINGRKLNVIYEDGKCSGKDASIAAQKLADVDKVNIIIGGVCSSETLAIAPITEKAKVIIFSPASSNPAITDAGEYIFRSAPSDTESGRFAAEKMIKKYKNVSVLSENTDYPQGVRNVFKNKLAGLGGSILADETFEQNSRDFRTQILKIKDSSPEAVFFVPQSGTTQGLAIKQMRELGLDKQIYTVIAAADAIDIAGNAMEGTMVVDVPELAKSGRSFIDQYKKTYNSDPVNDWFAGSSYDSVFIISNALRKCGENTGCVKNFLYNMDWYEGTIGRYKFDNKGDVIGIVFALKIVRNSTFALYDAP